MTSATRAASRAFLDWGGFGLLLALTLAIWALYGANLGRWPSSPDFGWRTMYNLGPNVVSQVFEAGAAVGLRPGDQIVAINGRTYTTFDELFFGDLRHGEAGSVNVYTVRREGRTLEISVPTGRVGLGAVLWRSGPLFALGLVYILIGVLVYLMKPHVAESTLFLWMTCLLGISVSLASPADLIHPTWLYDVRLLSRALTPAVMVHLALLFPKRRDVLARRPWVACLAYVPSLAIFAFQQATTTAYWNTPKSILLLWVGYSVGGVLFFLGMTGWNSLRDASIITRLQSRVIFVGIVLGFFIPGFDLLSGLLWRVTLFSDPILGFGLCFSFFPLSIGYTIVKHDLFAIDTIVRRTYGYVLSKIGRASCRERV